MTNELRKTYFKLLAPVILALGIIGFAKLLGLLKINETKVQTALVPSVFILAVIFAVALPVLLRCLFAHKVRYHISIPEFELIKFERSLIYVITVTPYLALIACLFKFPLFHLAGTVLMSLYALYYYYPSEKRIQFDKRIFRVK